MNTKLVKALTAAMLTASIITSTAAIPAGAIGVITEDNPQGLRYAFYDDGVRILDCDDNVEDLVIPASIEGIPVIGFENSMGDLGSSFVGCDHLRTVTLPASVEFSSRDFFQPTLSAIYIDDAAASEYDIDGVVYRKGENGDILIYYPPGREGDYAIPDGIARIGTGFVWADPGFDNAARLTSLYIPASVTSIMAYFSGCTSLTAFTVAEDNPNYCSVDGVLFNKDKTELIAYPAAREGAYTVPEGVTSIAGGAFSGCAGLTALTLPEGVTKFDGVDHCESLASLTLPASLTSLGSIEYCPGLTELTIPAGVTSVGSIGGCPGLTELTIPEGVASMGSITDCENLAVLHLPEGLTNMGGIQNCALTELAIPAGITTMYGYIMNCPQLASITLPEGMTTAPTISNCPALTSLRFPDGVTRVYVYDCTALTSVNVPDAVDWGLTFRNCPSLTEIEISDSHPYYAYADGLFIDIDRTNHSISSCLDSKTGEVTIPEDVTVISGGAFRDCTGITAVHFHEGFTEISTGAFQNCTSLTSVKLPGGLEALLSEAFDGCTSLTTVDIPASLKSLYKSFTGCTSLTGFTLSEGSEYLSVQDGVLYSKDGTQLVCCPAGKEGVFTVPDGVTSIAEGAFAGCTKLTQIVLPEGVKEIGSGAFDGCTALETVELPEGLTTIGRETFLGCTALRELTIPKSVTKLGYRSVVDCTSLEKVTILNPYCSLDNYNNIFVNDYDHYWWYYTGTICGYENSTAQIHARHNAYRFESIGKVPVLGDVNNDGNVNANDATAVLMAAARIGAKRDSGLSDIQAMAANTDASNAAVNANDASFILRYAACRGAKGTKSIYSYLGYEA
ncbi:MAG: leucine-rich repeat protein [Oscillospiraceae bacterium]|nr:leucine-rich repeat protein [Oscillospiraceae bacterium]